MIILGKYICNAPIVMKLPTKSFMMWSMEDNLSSNREKVNTAVRIEWHRKCTHSGDHICCHLTFLFHITEGLQIPCQMIRDRGDCILGILQSILVPVSELSNPVENM